MLTRSGVPLGHEAGHMPRDAPLICPREHRRFLGGSGAEVFGMRSDSDPAQIESVRVPTGLNCDVAFCLSRSVKRTGDPEEFKILV